MKPYNGKPYNRKSLLVAGAACIVIAISNFSTRDINAGIFWVFLGVCVFLWASRMKDGDDSNSGASNELFKKGPDGNPFENPEEPGAPEPPKPEGDEPRRDASVDDTPYTTEPEETAGLGDDQERREELKSLFDSGVISREEYEERLSQTKKG